MSGGDAPIRVVLRRADFMRRLPCAICGGSTDKEEVLAVFTDEDGDEHAVCCLCLESGPATVADRLLAQAHRTERWAIACRSWSEREWLMPTLAEWLEAQRDEVAS
jgi:hypothetical protein